MIHKFSKRLLLLFSLPWFLSLTFADNYKTISNQEIKSLYAGLPFEMPLIKALKFKKYSVRITDFGAVGNGVTLNTQAFENAIAAVSKKGGGTVIVPEGIWLTGPITLLSNINLFLEKNAMIRFSTDFNLYPIVDAIFEGLNTKRCQSPITGYSGAY
ncbi:MAG: glycosyl hydrolase family 28-related protein [Paludibacter sp.]|nr:glycosyl hydrolase family 28-related protein [Paludibacter sp.]